MPETEVCFLNGKSISPSYTLISREKSRQKNLDNDNHDRVMNQHVAHNLFVLGISVQDNLA